MSEQAEQHTMNTCWWHPDRQTGLRCARCERPACPECLREASVGYHCVDCVHSARKQAKARAASYRKAGFGYRTVAGARASSRVVVTPVLIAINAIVFVVTAAQAQSVMANQASPLFAEGTLFTPAIAVNGEWWRLVTSGFLHFGLLHLAVNMLMLWLLGRDLELLLGKIRYTVVYLLSLLGGSVAVFTFESLLKSTAGASGALYGVLGGMLVAVLRLKLNATPVIGVIAINLFISVQIEAISLLGHLGGLVIGALATAAMVYAPERRRVAMQTTVAVLLLAAMVGIVLTRDAQLTTDYICSQVNCFAPGTNA
ncbi:rhomboid family intramembrane serine protease [Haloechinothrix salitolerans]|uniref:Rhomboid family intramembrane serine protease n=1 Tax=Haloechinothrix salitolerans TaxID=926830 RepID=A0ABW2BSW3_9PSEU